MGAATSSLARRRLLGLQPKEDQLAGPREGGDDDPLWSHACGTVARLPNGNTLVTESDGGRAVEVTRDGEVAWEFHSPHRVGTSPEYVATLFEVVRLPAGLPTDWTRAPQGGEDSE